MTLRAIVVDDEPLARARISRLLRSLDVQLLAEGENGQQAINLVHQFQPDLLFLDIQMPLMNGLEAARIIVESSDPIPAIVFCTAFDQYAIKAFDVQATAYLLKPVMKEDLQKSILQASKLNRSQQTQLLDNASKGNFINVRHDDYIEKINIAEFQYFRSSDKQVIGGTKDDGEIILDYSLKGLEDNVGDKFLRIHRSTLVNKDHMKKLNRLANGNVSISLNDCAMEFSVSRRHLTHVKKHFE